MFGRQFLRTGIGAAAVVSVTAMVSVNLFALTYQVDQRLPDDAVSAAAHPVELA